MNEIRDLIIGIDFGKDYFHNKPFFAACKGFQ